MLLCSATNEQWINLIRTPVDGFPPLTDSISYTVTRVPAQYTYHLH